MACLAKRVESLHGNRYAGPIVWMTLSAASIRGLSKSLLLSSKVHHVPNWKSALLVKKNLLKIKINKSMDFTESVLAAICFCHVRR